MKPTYNFLHYGFGKPFVRCSVPCEILDESSKRYKIKILANNVHGRNYGDVISVMKKSVTFPKSKPDCTDAWWHN